MEERTIKFKIVIQGECTPEEQSKVRKMYDFIEQYAKDHGYKATKTAGIKELMESEEKNTVAVKVDVDTKEANESIKELTEAADQCVASFEKLEKKLNRFQTKPVTYKDWYLENISKAQHLGGSITAGIDGTGYLK